MVAILLGAASVPRSFQESLLPRSTPDQGIVTGITVALVYVMGLLVQDGIDATAETISSGKNSKNGSSPTAAIAASAAALGAGYYLQKRVKYDKDETLPRSAVRTSGYWLQNAGIAGLLVSGIEMAHNVTSKNSKSDQEKDLLPLIVGAGIILSLYGEYERVKDEEDRSVKETLIGSKPIRAVAISTVVLGALGAVAYSERTIAKTVDSLLEKTAPKLKNTWLPAGHLVGAGLLAFGLVTFVKKIYGDIEHKADEFEEAYKKAPASPYVSGGRGSKVGWDTITIQGRRHIGARLSSAKIKSITKGAVKEPIRIYVGLDSAETEEDRVELALNELERTGAYKRGLITVVSPTGTGYVNYVMSDAVEYLSRGDVASVTIQYSKRPSPMSLDRVDEGHFQYRMLLNGISKKIESLPKNKRPRVVLFGESLGAWTSQDALMHGGTDALKALGVDRALWIGTPKGSKWKDQVLSKKWLNTDKELVGLFDNYQEYLEIETNKRNKIRYVMVTHYNDPIAHFGLDILIKQPEWVEDESKRPKSLGPNVKYRTPALFAQTLIDMKNALKPEPGKFVASAHDYRGDIAQFVATVFGLKANRDQLDLIEKALRQNEITRAKELEDSNSDKDK